MSSFLVPQRVPYAGGQLDQFKDFSSSLGACGSEPISSTGGGEAHRHADHIGRHGRQDPGVGAHIFKTTQQGGQPCIFLIDGENLDSLILNGPDAAHNGLDLTVSAGTHTFTIYAERYNSHTWTNYSIHLFFDLADAPQISAMAPLNNVDAVPVREQAGRRTEPRLYVK
jgi:hypothetical protein